MSTIRGSTERATGPRLALPGLVLLGVVLLGVVLLGLSPTAAAAQDPAAGAPVSGAAGLPDLTAAPDSAAALFLRSVRAIRWSAAAQFIHPETLRRFYETTRMIAAADTSGAMSRFLADADSVTLRGLDPGELFARAVGATIDDMPGLMHSIYDRDDEVLGHVVEGADSAHVVYRTTARISGAVSEVKVMQLGRVPDDGWRVLWSDELEVLDAALRGVGR